jgi:hypothetical protein
MFCGNKEVGRISGTLLTKGEANSLEKSKGRRGQRKVSYFSLV